MTRRKIRKVNASRQNAATYDHLESRQMLASLTVVDLVDTPDGNIGTLRMTPYEDGIAAVAARANTGFELWFSNSFGDGGYQIDVLPGPASSNPELLGVAGDNLFFTGLNQSGERTLWTSNGTPHGTLELSTEVEPARGQPGIVFQNRFFFAADDGVNGRELWASDGTVQGTGLVKDIGVGSASSYPRNFVEYDGELFFSTLNGVYRTDGTGSGTTLAFNGDFVPKAALQGSELLILQDGGRLLASDGSSSSPQLIADFASDSFLTFHETSDELYFGANIGSGIELWVTDGTASGTSFITNFDGIGEGVLSPTSVDGDVYMFLYNGSGEDLNLWKVDGITQSANPVQLVKPVGINSLVAGPDGRAYYAASDGEIWSTNGNARSARLEGRLGTQINSGLTSVGEKIFAFSRSQSNSGELSIWSLDNGVVNELSAPSDLTEGLRVDAITTIDGRAFSRDSSSYSQPRLVVSDGTIAGTNFTSFSPGQYYKWKHNAVAVDGRLLLSANNRFTGANELWVLDTTENDSFYQVEGYDIDSRIVVDGNQAYFVNRASGRYQVVSIDGTEAGTNMLFELDRQITNLAIVDGTFYFTAGGFLEPGRVFVSDGTQAGTNPLLIRAEIKPYLAAHFTSTGNGEVLFKAGTKLFVTDGSSAGTREIYSQLSVFDGPAFFEQDGLIYFVNDGGDLLATDGSQAGTRILATDTVDNNWFFNEPGEVFEALNNEVYFAGASELLKTDGTAAGTVVLDGPLDPAHLQVFEGMIYFAAGQMENGRELWMSDGTNSGTTIVSDHVTGPATTDVLFLEATEDDLFFVYESETSGAEIGFLDPGFAPAPLVASAGLIATSIGSRSAANPTETTRRHGSTNVRESHHSLAGSHKLVDHFFESNETSSNRGFTNDRVRSLLEGLENDSGITLL